MKETGIFIGEHEAMEHTILSELEPYPQFVTWRFHEVNGRQTKPPFNPATGEFASPTDPSTWSTLETAQQALQTGKYEGLGFVFTKNDEFVGIDLDHAVKEDGMLEVWAAEIVLSLNSYVETSPSGTGLHILTRGTLPEGGRRNGSIEIYDRDRYFTITTNHLGGTPEAILPSQEAIEALYESLAVPQHPQAKEMRPRAEYTLTRRDDEVLEKALGAKNGASFRQLWQGDIAGFESKSEADFTLVLRLLYWSGNNIYQTERLFRQSALYDEKTDRPIKGMTYIQYTIKNAMKKRHPR